jgi:hypothetical protein
MPTVSDPSELRPLLHERMSDDFACDVFLEPQREVTAMMVPVGAATPL